MSKRDAAVGRKFLADYSYDRYRNLREIHIPERPEPILSTKPAEGWLALPAHTVPTLGEIDELSASLSLKGVSSVERLTALLHYTLGIIRLEAGTPRPYHRATPSPRCLYATELYVCPAGSGWLGETGVYRYHPVKHGLERRRAGAWLPVIERAVGRSLAGAEGVLIVSADTWRIAHYYLDFAFNIAALEAGHAIGHLHLLARRLGWRVTVDDCFVDQDLITLLGLNGQSEAPLAVITLWGDDLSGREPDGDLSLSELPVSRRFDAITSQLTDLQGLMAASRYASKEEFPDAGAFLPTAPDERSDDAIPLQGDGVVWQESDLREILIRRNSGNDKIGLATGGRPVDLQRVARMLGGLAAEQDLFWLQALDQVDLYLVAHRVTGLLPGVYRMRWSDLSLLPLRTGGDEIARQMQDVSSVDGKILNVRSFPFTIFLCADFEAAFERYGNRGYQILHTKAGGIAQYLSLFAEATGWLLRPVRSYRDVEAEWLLGIERTPKVIVYHLLIGEPKTPYLSFDLGL